MTPDQLRKALEIHFTQSDVDRINALSDRAGDGLLTPEENAELDCYVHAGQLLSILKAKIRLKLRKMDPP